MPITSKKALVMGDGTYWVRWMADLQATKWNVTLGGGTNKTAISSSQDGISERY